MLHECIACHRHHLAAADACPFCGHRVGRSSLAYRIATHPLVTATVLPLVLTACYGGSWKDTDTNGWTPDDTDDYWTDADEDGFYLAEDCDDENPDVNPNAAENCGNEIDDDCDDLIDAEDDDCEDVDPSDTETSSDTDS